MTSHAATKWARAVMFGGPPAAWMAHLLFSYAWVPAACAGSGWSLHVITGVFIVVAGASMAWGIRRGGAGEMPGGLLLGALFVLAIALQGAANAWVDPCV